jgi:hypothetical protein
MGNYNDFFEQLEARLQSQGFWVTRNVGSGNERYDLFASRQEVSTFKNRSFYIIAASLEGVDKKMFREYAKRAFKFGLAHRYPYRPRGLGRQMVFFPVIVSNDITDELKRWLDKSMPEVHFADAFEFPVILSPKERKIYYYGFYPPFNVPESFYDRFVEFANTELGFL